MNDAVETTIAERQERWASRSSCTSSPLVDLPHQPMIAAWPAASAASGVWNSAMLVPGALLADAMPILSRLGPAARQGSTSHVRGRGLWLPIGSAPHLTDRRVAAL